MGKDSSRSLSGNTDVALQKVEEAVGELVKFTKYKSGYLASYKRMVATRKWWDSPSWNHLQKELESLGETWLTELRSDLDFKEFYKLKAEVDRLEVLLK